MELKFFTKTAPAMGIDHGEANVYVVLPPGHPMHGARYDDIPVVVHGGLTFAEPAEDLDWPELGDSDKNGWVVGFDTCHYGDTARRWPTSKVLLEAKSLADQLIELAK